MNCEVRPAGSFSPGCQGLWRFGKRTPPGLDRSNGSLSELAADSLAALFLASMGYRSEDSAWDEGSVPVKKLQHSRMNSNPS